MKELTSLPCPFILWWWENSYNEHACPSYIKYEFHSEYGCTMPEYMNDHSDIVISEVKPYMLGRFTTGEIKELLDKWNEHVKSHYEILNEYYQRTLNEIEKLN